MSKVTFRESGFAEGKKIFCSYKGYSFGEIHRSNNRCWYMQFAEGLEISNGKILRAIAKKLDKLNHEDK